MSEEYAKRGEQIVLHEDKQYYPEAEKIYGQGVEALVEEEDHQPLTQPIIEPVKDKFSQLYEKEIPKTFYSDLYMASIMSKPQLIRNVAIIGGFHHGKTLLSDMIL